MTLFRALHAETLKLRRTLAWKLVLIAPLAIILLTLFMASQAPYSTLRRTGSTVDAWGSLARVNFQLWELLMLPLYVTLQTALIAGLDHQDNQWKALFARPVPRWATWLSKLALVSAMVSASTALLVAGVWAEGQFLNWFDSTLGFARRAPFAVMLRQAAQMTGLAFLFLTLQHWVSLRWRSFSVAVGFGIVAMIAGFAMLLSAGPYGAWPQYFPWALPMLVLARHPQDIASTLVLSLFAAAAVATAGCTDFCKRENG